MNVERDDLPSQWMRLRIRPIRVANTTWITSLNLALSARGTRQLSSFRKMLSSLCLSQLHVVSLRLSELRTANRDVVGVGVLIKLRGN